MASWKMGAETKAALALAAGLILLGVIAANAMVTILVTPIVFIVLAFVMTRVPIRLSMLTLAFCALTLENPAEYPGSGLWETPFKNVGGILLNNLNSIDRDIGALSPLAFSGMDVCLVILLLVAASRRASGSKIDSQGRAPTPSPLVRLAFLSLGGMTIAWLLGTLQGGEFRFALWQVRRVVYLPVVFYLFHVGLRGPKDAAVLGKLLLGAATYRAALAIYIQNNYAMPPDPDTGSTKLPYATTHHDSILFATAFVLLLTLVMERTGKKVKRIALVLLPILGVGMVENGRRLVWVHVGLSVVMLYLVTKDSPIKRRIQRAFFVATPLLIVYVIAGWDSQWGRLFKPVRMIRSVVDSKSDASSFWRELENMDLVLTFRRTPLFGTGYGIPYDEIIKLPALPSYELERYVPHNSVLGLWCYTGIVGYTCLTLLWVGGAYFAFRVYYRAQDPMLRATALTCAGAILVYMSQCWGDMGLGSWTGVFLVAPAVAFSGKAAVAIGEWSGSKTTKTVREQSPRPVRTERAEHAV